MQDFLLKNESWCLRKLDTLDIDWQLCNHSQIDLRKLGVTWGSLPLTPFLKTTRSSLPTHLLQQQSTQSWRRKNFYCVISRKCMRILMYLHMQSKFKTNNNGDGNGNGNTSPTYLDLVLFDKFQNFQNILDSLLFFID